MDLELLRFGRMSLCWCRAKIILGPFAEHVRISGGRLEWWLGRLYLQVRPE
jgi:hypothetical protein